MSGEELVDLVDAFGRVRERAVPRSLIRDQERELRGRGLYQPIVVVVVVNLDREILCQVRGRRKGRDGAGEIDHVCGVVASGETWELTAEREAQEELSVRLERLLPVSRGVNVNDRYRTLAVAQTLDDPSIRDRHEVASVFTSTASGLVALQHEGRRFVNGYFADLWAALEHRGTRAEAGGAW